MELLENEAMVAFSEAAELIAAAVADVAPGTGEWRDFYRAYFETDPDTGKPISDTDVVLAQGSLMVNLGAKPLKILSALIKSSRKASLGKRH